MVLRGQTVFLDGHAVGNPGGRNVLVNSRMGSNIAASPSLRRRSITNAGFESKSPARVRLFSTDLTSNKVGTTEMKAEEPIDGSHVSSKYIKDLPRSVANIKASPFYQKHVLAVNMFDRKDLHTLFGVAQEMRSLVEKQGQINLLQGKLMCSAFWEPSTRTSCSFEAAMTRLGGGVVSINQITSSIAKGESLGDTGNSF